MDPVGDMLTRIRNGYLASHQEVKIPYSQIKARLAEILAREGFLEKVTCEKEKRLVNVTLKYLGKKPAVTSIKRISRPGQRRYLKAKEITPILSGLGLLILSTPSGLLTSQEAKKKHLGGEIICEIY